MSYGYAPEAILLWVAEWVAKINRLNNVRACVGAGTGSAETFERIGASWLARVVDKKTKRSLLSSTNRPSRSLFYRLKYINTIRDTVPLRGRNGVAIRKAHHY